jgi:hypothetical protein
MLISNNQGSFLMPHSISELKGKIFQGSTPMSLEWEKAHLLRADQFVADGERRVSEQATRINHMLDSGHDVSEAQGRLTGLVTSGALAASSLAS